MDAAKKIILALWLVVMTVANASAFTQNAPENRVWENFNQTPETHQAEAAQVPQTHQEKPSFGYENAVGCCLAAKAPVVRNPNVYEALFEAPITGTTRGAHRASANNFLANELSQNADLAALFNRELGVDVLSHMQSGKSLLNPPGAVWHHPFDNPSVMQLLRGGEHTSPALQPILHPEGIGGFGNFYGF